MNWPGLAGASDINTGPLSQNRIDKFVYADGNTLSNGQFLWELFHLFILGINPRRVFIDND